MNPTRWQRLKNHFADRLRQSREAREQQRERVRLAKLEEKRDEENLQRCLAAGRELQPMRRLPSPPTGGYDVTSTAGMAATTWQIWVENGTSTSTAYINHPTTGQAAWGNWIQLHCNPIQTTGSSDIFQQWVVNPTITTSLNYATAQTQIHIFNQWVHQPRSRERVQVMESEELKRYHAEREEAHRRWQEEQKARDAKIKKAADTARQLLLSMLNFQQKMDLEQHGYFYVEAKSGRLYRIDYGTHGNVRVVDRKTKQILERLCIQPESVPAGDANLVQKLLIETAEDTFRRFANITDAQGRMISASVGTLLTGEKLAEVIPLRPTG